MIEGFSLFFSYHVHSVSHTKLMLGAFDYSYASLLWNWPQDSSSLLWAAKSYHLEVFGEFRLISIIKAVRNSLLGVYIFNIMIIPWTLQVSGRQWNEIILSSFSWLERCSLLVNEAIQAFLLGDRVFYITIGLLITQSEWKPHTNV